MSNFPEFYHILIIKEPKNRCIVTLENNVYSIGRAPDNSIVIYEDERVSRYHSTLFKKIINPQTEHYSYWIIDGDSKGRRSTNGLLINGQSRLEHELKHGDIIQFGNSTQGEYYILDFISGQKLFEIDKTNDRERPSPIAQTDQTSKQTILLNQKLNQLSQEDLVRLASFPEFSPNPIVEIDITGNITYLNSSAAIKFEDIYQTKLEHPLLAGLLTESQNINGKLLVREVEIDREVFEQYIHYLGESKLIRSYIFNITERKQIETQLRDSEERYRAVVRQSSEGIFLADVTSKIILEANQAYCQLLGYSFEEIKKLTLYDVVDLDPKQFESSLERILREKISFVQESLHRKKDGSLIEVEVTLSPINYSSQNVLCFAVRDITERKLGQAILSYQAFHDFLTDLPNRMLFNKQLCKAIANAQRNQKFMAVMFLDIDRFKNINDNLGHAVGDSLLKCFAQRLKGCLRSHDIVARWGGDEFIVFVPEIQNPEEAGKIAQRILDAIQPTFKLEHYELHIKSSMGIAIYPIDGEDGETLVKNADIALYSAKEQGRNKYCFFSSTMTSGTSMLLTVENLLHHAIEREELFVYYQPQVNINTGQITGMEALLRWRNPSLGTISPGKFIPVAEETGLIIPIGEWVLHAACKQNQIWQSAGLLPLRVAVNISPRQFQQPNLVSMVKKILDETGLEPHWLELEITETSIMNNVDLATKTLHDLQKIGVHLSIDDFGTGYSSLSYLKQFPFCALKIDRSFIQDLEDNSEDKAIISAIIALGRGLNLRVVAEGVETPQQIDLLQSLQCSEIQGYWFSHPLTPEDAAKFTKSKTCLTISDRSVL